MEQRSSSYIKHARSHVSSNVVDIHEKTFNVLCTGNLYKLGEFYFYDPTIWFTHGGLQ